MLKYRDFYFPPISDLIGKGWGIQVGICDQAIKDIKDHSFQCSTKLYRKETLLGNNSKAVYSANLILPFGNSIYK